MVSQKQTKLLQRLTVLVGIAGASTLVAFQAMAQSKLNPNPSIFNEPPYNAGQVRRSTQPQAPTDAAESPKASPTETLPSGAQPAPASEGEMAPTTPSESSTSTSSFTIAQVAASSGSFKTLTAALAAAGLEETLSQEGPYTVFAPTDEAFAALPAGTVETLLKPENKEQLVKVLTYHVVPGEVTSDQLASGEVKTVEGSSVKVEVGENGVKVNDAKVVQPDVKASNGVIHVIDKVILPPNL